MSVHIYKTWVDEYGFEIVDFKSGIQIVLDNDKGVVEINDYRGWLNRPEQEV